MDERLSYKIGEAVWIQFLQKDIDNLCKAFDECVKMICEQVDQLQHLLSEIIEHVFIAEKIKQPRPIKVIRPRKAAPLYRIIPHARTVC